MNTELTTTNWEKLLLDKVGTALERIAVLENELNTLKSYQGNVWQTLVEAEDKIGITPQTIKKWIKASESGDRYPPLKNGTHYRFRGKKYEVNVMNMTAYLNSI